MKIGELSAGIEGNTLGESTEKAIFDCPVEGRRVMEKGVQIVSIIKIYVVANNGVTAISNISGVSIRN